MRILAGLVGGLLLLAGLYPVVQIRQQVTKMQEQQKKLQKDLQRLNSSQGDITSLLAEQAHLTELAGFGGELDKFKIINSAIIIELASATPSQIFLTEATFNTDASPPTFRLQGHADNSDSVFEYLNILGKSMIFATPVLESTNEMPIDDTRYFIRFALNGKIKVDELKKMAGIETEPGSPEEPAGEENFFE
ncbi:MAG: hypothetical protein ACD_39C00205G0001 [uncultured bacterium]|nr:MAG: hypothetical protein ACD_39C00205G0001 [uncultured bacterium]